MPLSNTLNKTWTSGRHWSQQLKRSLGGLDHLGYLIVLARAFLKEGHRACCVLRVKRRKWLRRGSENEGKGHNRLWFFTKTDSFGGQRTPIPEEGWTVKGWNVFNQIS